MYPFLYSEVVFINSLKVWERCSLNAPWIIERSLGAVRGKEILYFPHVLKLLLLIERSSQIHTSTIRELGRRQTVIMDGWLDRFKDGCCVVHWEVRHCAWLSSPWVSWFIVVLCDVTDQRNVQQHLFLFSTGWGPKTPHSDCSTWYRSIAYPFQSNKFGGRRSATFSFIPSLSASSSLYLGALSCNLTSCQ